MAVASNGVIAMPVKPARIANEAPCAATVTDYDEAHLPTYIRLLDAIRVGASQKEICKVLFEIDADLEPERARLCFETHRKRAQWMTEKGYRLLLNKIGSIAPPRRKRRH